jgi:hypothetical protein
MWLYVDDEGLDQKNQSVNVSNIVAARLMDWWEEPGGAM